MVPIDLPRPNSGEPSTWPITGPSHLQDIVCGPMLTKDSSHAAPVFRTWHGTLTSSNTQHTGVSFERHPYSSCDRMFPEPTQSSFLTSFQTTAAKWRRVFSDAGLTKPHKLGKNASECHTRSAAACFLSQTPSPAPCIRAVHAVEASEEAGAQVAEAEALVVAVAADVAEAEVDVVEADVVAEGGPE